MFACIWYSRPRACVRLTPPCQESVLFWALVVQYWLWAQGVLNLTCPPGPPLANRQSIPVTGTLYLSGLLMKTLAPHYLFLALATQGAEARSQAKLILNAASHHTWHEQISKRFARLVQLLDLMTTIFDSQDLAEDYYFFQIWTVVFWNDAVPRRWARVSGLFLLFLDGSRSWDAWSEGRIQREGPPGSKRG